MIGKLQTEIKRHGIASAVAYCRVSSDKQRENTSIAGQADYLQKTMAQCGVALRRIFKEVGSGKDDERAALLQAYDFCRAWNRKARNDKDRIKLLVIYDWTRWFRNRDLSSHWRIKFQQVGVMVNCPGRWVDYTDAGSIILHSVQEGMAHAEHLVISQRAVKSHYDLNAKGYVSGKLPRWLMRTDRLDATGRPVVELNPAVAPACRAAFEQVAANLSAAQAFNRNGGSKVFGGRSTFYAMLSNPLCGGRIIKQSTVEGLPDIDVESAYPALVSWQLFMQVQQRLECFKGSVRTVESEVLFPAKGVLRCHQCGAHTTSEMPTGGSGKVYHYYRCSKDVTHGRLHKDGIDSLLQSIIQDIALAPHAAQYVAKRIKEKQREARHAIHNRINALEQSRKAVEQRVSRARDLLIDGVLDKDDLQAVKSQLEDVRSRIAEQRFFMDNQGRTTDAALALLGNLGGIVRSAGAKEMNLLLQMIFPDGFTVEPGNYAACRTRRLNTIFSISGLLSGSYASIKLETGSETDTRPVKGPTPDTNRTQLDIYKADFEAVMSCYLILNAA